MIVSENQRAANRRNSQQSSGPKTPEGKDAVRFSALNWGLCARNHLLAADNPADYQQMWDGLDADWQPPTHTERYYLEGMVTSQWLLARLARSETRICDADLAIGRQLDGPARTPAVTKAAPGPAPAAARASDRNGDGRSGAGFKASRTTGPASRLQDVRLPHPSTRTEPTTNHPRPTTRF